MTKFSPLEQFDVVKLFYFEHVGNDISFTNILISFFLLNCLLILLIAFLSLNLKLVPDVLQYLFERLYCFIFLILKQQTGKVGYKYFPIIFTIFNFIFFCNLASLLPFGIAITSHIIIITFLSATLCGGIFLIGLLTHNLKFLKIFIPQCPFPLLFILIPIEIFSYIIRIFSLSIRLAANILAGHTLVFIISSFIINMYKVNVILAFFCFLPLILILILEFGVAFLQAYIFTILICIYLSDSLNIKIH